VAEPKRHPHRHEGLRPLYLAEDFDFFGWQLTDAEMDQLNKATSPSGALLFSCSS